MIKYCFEFMSPVDIPDKVQVEISGCIRAKVPECCELKIDVCHGANRTPAFKNVLTEAEHLIFGDRNDDYGHPLDDFTCTASMWSAYLRHRNLLRPGAELRAEDVPMMMIS